jgi:apolipoprotein N-acyltransferase
MKISQYNWGWWFVSTLLVILIGMMIAMVSQKESELMVSNIILIVGMISMVPCLYVGCKPTEN